ncbi:MAG: DUF3944 domain-containing protein [Deferribacterales bacterium]
MAYRLDADLEFLQDMESNELEDLVTVLIKDKDGELRLTEELTTSDKYKRYSPNHIQYWDLIAEEIQRFGGNTFANLLRFGEGVLYKEVLCDVCDKMKVNYNKNSTTINIEQNLFLKIFEDATREMSQEELKEVAKELELKTTDFTANGITMAVQFAIKKGGFKSYQIAVIVANAVMKAIFGRGLSLAANATLTRTISIFAGPIGWIITGLWTAIDIAGPAYRVTIPAVIQIAYLRQLYMTKSMEESTDEQ